MSAYVVTTQNSVVKAAIIGNAGNISSFLSSELRSQGLASDLIDIQSDFSLYKYFFLCLEINQESNSLLLDFLNKEIPLDAKVTLVFSYTRFSKKTKRSLEKINESLTNALQTRLNIRVVFLHDLYGPSIAFSKESLVGKLTRPNSTEQISIKADDEALIFPLHVDDAVKGVIKATFVRSSFGKLYELGGEPISVLNFAYKVRSLASNVRVHIEAGSTYTQEESLKYRHLIKLTQDELHWKPTTELTSGLKELFRDRPPLLTLSPAPTRPLPEPEVSAPVEAPLIETVVVTRPEHLALETTDTTPPPVQNKAPDPKVFSLKKGIFSRSIKPKKKVIKAKGNHFSFKRRPFKFFVLLVGLSVFFASITPVLGFGYDVWSINNNVRQLKTAVAERNLDSLLQVFENLEDNSASLQKKIDFYYSPLGFFLGQTQREKLVRLNALLDYFSRAGVALSHASEYGSQSAKLITGQEEGSTEEKLHLAETKITESYHYLSLAQALIDENPSLTEIDLLDIGTQVEDIYEKLPESRVLLYQLQQLLLSAPEILGENGRRVYLVLLQNNMELRPTGGFIGSYATLVFENGQLLDLQVEDVYTADGQLNGYVKPPEPIEKYLGEASWFLRDSNWNPDFPSTAETASWFLEKEMGVKVDGVIGINLQVIQEMLAITGPIELPDYKETITSENLYERLQYQSEINFFPGSTQKRDYLGQLTRNIYQDLQNSDSHQLVGMVQALVSSANAKQLTVALKNPQAGQVFKELSWNGSVINPSCDLENGGACVNDYFSIREANVGVNKANFFVTRDTKHEVLVGEKETIHTVTLSLNNSSTSNAWPGGTYRNYLRVYTPKDSKLNQVTINNAPVDLNTVAQNYESNKAVWGFINATDPGQTSTIVIKYTLPRGLKQEALSGYQLYLQKQPGTGADRYTTTIQYPEIYQVARTSIDTKQQANKLVINDVLDTDKSYRIEFVR